MPPLPLKTWFVALPVAYAEGDWYDRKACGRAHQNWEPVA
jgi:hypothetical protein